MIYATLLSLLMIGGGLFALAGGISSGNLPAIGFGLLVICLGFLMSTVAAVGGSILGKLDKIHRRQLSDWADRMSAETEFKRRYPSVTRPLDIEVVVPKNEGQ